MSYLLLKPRAGKGHNAKNHTLFSSTSVVDQRHGYSKPHQTHASSIRRVSNDDSTRVNVYKSHMTGGQDQMQQMIQRKPVVTPHQKRTTKSRQRDQSRMEVKQQSTQKVQEQAVISMEEVMEDLRVLEQQQRESQRLLSSVKLTKKHKIEQRSQFESNLSTLKYANGEQRVKLIRERESLSACTRELGALKLQSCHANDFLKDFNQKLRKAMTTVRELQLYKHKLNSALNRLQALRSLMSTRIKNSKINLKSTENKLDEAKRQKEIIINSIQSNKSKSRVLAQEVLDIHANTLGLEHDLIAAQQMEASTKFRVDSILQDFVDEETRFEATKQVSEGKINELKELKRSNLKKVEILKCSIGEEKKKLHELHGKCLKYPHEEGEDKTKTMNGDAPLLNVESIRLSLREEEKLLAQENITKRSLKDGRKKLEEKANEIEKMEKEMNNSTTTLKKKLQIEEQVEKKRKLDNFGFMTEFDSENDQILNLEQSFVALARRCAETKVSSKDELNTLDDTLKSQQVKLERMRNELISRGEILKKRKHFFESQRKTNTVCITNAVNAEDDLKNIFEKNKASTKLVSTSFEKDDDLNNEACIKEQKNINSELELFVNNLRVGTPSLANLDNHLDCSLPIETNIENALTSLRLSCKDQVEHAQQERNLKIRVQKDVLNRQRKIEEQKRITREENERKEKEKLERQSLAEEAERLRLKVVKERQRAKESKRNTIPEKKSPEGKNDAFEHEDKNQDDLSIDFYAIKSQRLSLKHVTSKSIGNEKVITTKSSKSKIKSCLRSKNLKQKKTIEANMNNGENKSILQKKQKRFLTVAKSRRERASAKKKIQQEALEMEEMMQHEEDNDIVSMKNNENVRRAKDRCKVSDVEKDEINSERSHKKEIIKRRNYRVSGILGSTEKGKAAEDEISDKFKTRRKSMVAQRTDKEREGSGGDFSECIPEKKTDMSDNGGNEADQSLNSKLLNGLVKNNPERIIEGEKSKDGQRNEYTSLMKLQRSKASSTKSKKEGSRKSRSETFRHIDDKESSLKKRKRKMLQKGASKNLSNEIDVEKRKRKRRKYSNSKTSSTINDVPSEFISSPSKQKSNVPLNKKKDKGCKSVQKSIFSDKSKKNSEHSDTFGFGSPSSSKKGINRNTLSSKRDVATCKLNENPLATQISASFSLGQDSKTAISGRTLNMRRRRKKDATGTSRKKKSFSTLDKSDCDFTFS